MSQTIAVIGECMIEIKPSPQAGGFEGQRVEASIGYGGDTLNCAIYLARLGTQVAYVSALGDDPASQWMLSEWRREGVDCQLVSCVDQAVPGLYLIDTDDTGERSFYYWRDQSPARRIFDDVHEAQALFARLSRFEYLYLSGITLGLYQVPVRERLYGFLDAFRAGGGKVCFDNNYRPRQWPDLGAAQDAFSQLYTRCDVALPTLEDERALFGEASAREVIERIQVAGVTELVLKKGADGCLIAAAAGESFEQVEPVKVQEVIDTTAAGDSFNAGYLAARFTGMGPREAARRGNRLASTVIRHPGAIIPVAAMPAE